jgi:hypothetical protein
VDEFRFGIVPHSSAVKGESDIAKFRGRDSGDADVDGLSLHVEAMEGHAGCGVPEKFVASGTAISANNVNFRLRTSYQCG